MPTATSAQYESKSGTIYCIPGQGSDKRLFDSLQFPDQWVVKFLEYGAPEKKETLEQFAKRLSEEIDTSEQFVFVGTSLGGMIAIELHELLNAQKCIIISSAKNRHEFPFRYRFQRTIPLYKILPGFVLLAGAKLLQPIVEPDRKNNKETFKSMLKAKKPVYMKRSIGMLINWKRSTNTKNVIHIHGTKDHTLPIRKIQGVNYIVSKGSHMMTLTKHVEISEIINSLMY